LLVRLDAINSRRLFVMGTELADDVAALRRFSRFYTRRIGVLHEGLSGSALTLTEGRIVYEIATRPDVTASSLATDLGLDPGYLSRILNALEGRALIERSRSPDDGRAIALSLTVAGRSEFERMDARSGKDVAALLAPLSPPQRHELMTAIASVERLLDQPETRARTIMLRPPRVGDIGWIVHRHGVLYAQEYGWDWTFEALVARVGADYIDKLDAKWDRCWIAEIDRKIVGSAFLVRKTDEIAKLRLVYVEPEQRGLGIGRRLVEACMDDARRIGYRRMTLWTNDVLLAARKIYASLGFQLVHSEPYRGFGKDLVGETWERDL
jgi:DNA-binding MarR family transcriptional regulator/GNAT superfamily N-acetyltransferase